MLTVYISDHCAGCRRAVMLVERLRCLRPAIALAVVNLDHEPARHLVIGTPVYFWNAQLLFMGNPAEDQLLHRLDALYEP